MVDCSCDAVREPSRTLKGGRFVCVNKILTAPESQREGRRFRENTHSPTQRKHKHAVPLEISPLLDYSTLSPTCGEQGSATRRDISYNSGVNLEVITHLGLNNRLLALM